MKCINTILIDDEPLAIEILKEYAAQVPQIKILDTFTNPLNANAYLQENKVDLIFLDINMPVLNGFNFLESLKKKPMVVITTAYEAYAVKSFEYEAMDYLVKPISFPRFLKAVNRVTRTHESGNSSITDNQSIFVKVDNKKLQKIYLNDILVVESLKDYIRIITRTDKHIVHKTLTGFTEELPRDNFIRIHRSYTVAIDKISAIEGNSVEIEGIRYTIGRSYAEEVKGKILN
ncbi:LytTR family DNA-binding domain-containing protein [Flavobacterium sp. ASW18X]|uniref:LytR/AlgR family response regulator transcription factor n=1 Tax=Flavobacterium sp. ASW18X TaxID=2572595 RepID=UPI0010AE03BD|nr:response regulator transcription factor [Flavobacterium sp. ASW18X]TKD59343.1 response regulator transcription factor [Flavobacterium sp. ASW18X]